MVTAHRPLCFPDAVLDRDDLFDRAAVLADVLGSFGRRTTVIKGPRLIGKTSLLNIVAIEAEGQGQAAVVRLAPTDSRSSLMAEILDGIRQWVHEHQQASHHDLARTRGHLIVRSHRRDSADQQEDGSDQPFKTVAQFCRLIAALAEQVKGVQFLLCIDEFDSLLQNWDKREAGLALELIGHLDTMPNLPVHFLLTLSTIPDLMLTSFRSPIINQSKIVTLESWNADETARFIEWLADSQLTFDAAAAAAMFAASGGHPYFTKAVLNALITAPAPPSRLVTAELVVAAVRRIAATPEVDNPLANLVSAHLSADAVLVLDRASGNPAGISTRSLAGLPSAGQLLHSLCADGLLRRQGDRYQLRLGLWREWRAATTMDARPSLPRRIGRLVRRIHGKRTTLVILVGTVSAPLVTFAAATAVLAPDRTIVTRPCSGSAAQLLAVTSYPAVASSGDVQQINLVLTNEGQSTVRVSALLSFPGSHARAVSANGYTFPAMRGGQDATFEIRFTTTVSAWWSNRPAARVPVRLVLSADGTCQPQRWSIGVAPVPRLQLVQKVAGSVLLVFLIPFLAALAVEMVSPRLRREWSGLRLGAVVKKKSR